MKQRLVIGLGNPLAGEDGVAVAVAAALWRDPHLPNDVDVLVGGTDLLRFAPQFSGRTEVFLIDALLEEAATEPVVFIENGEAALDDVQSDAHHLSAPAALDLMLLANAELACTTFTWCLIPVASAEAWTPLSRAAQARTHSIVQRVLRRLGSKADDLV